MSSNRIAGHLTISVNGELLNLEGEFEVDDNAIEERKGLIGTDGATQGYAETYKTPYISGSIRYTKGFDRQAFAKLDGVDAQVTLATGEVYVFSDGWVAKLGAYKSGESTMEFRFEAKTANRTS